MYASRTGTRRNLDALRRSGWRLLVSPTGCVRTEGFPYALDNGAWTAFQKGAPFDESAFLRAVERVGERADWIVVPDVVCDAHGTLDAFDRWWQRLRGSGLLLLALQNGMSESDVDGVLRTGVGLFIGGSDDWKERTAAQWGAFARARSLYLHMGRVNTARRISIAASAGCDSIDGTSASRFAVTVRPLTNAASQAAIVFPTGQKTGQVAAQAGKDTQE